ncbi:MAG: hypothetical protein KFH98_13580 [Gemmatimonadetes bacterium]|nr:hypothetical protein [Gemmatimonadota bacterium]
MGKIVVLGLTVIALVGGAAGAGHAQLPGLEDPLRTPVRFTGEIGSYGEFYSISGRERRRPSSTGRLFLRSSLELFGSVKVGLDLEYSTESGSGFGLSRSGRQPFNRIGIAPQWSWGRAYAGAFSDRYSPLTWDGIGLRGGGFSITPGPVRAAAFYGRSQSAVAGGAISGAYQRTMAGGKLGFGRTSERGEGAFIDLVFLRAADDMESLGVAAGESDNTIVNEFAVTPQENIVIAAVTRVPFWSDQLVVSGEVAASVHSRDRRAPELTDEALDEYAGLLRSLITPRASTYGDIAHNGKVELRNFALPGATQQSPRSLSASVGYRYIGAGYVSLGLASLPADQQALTADIGVRFRNWNASLRGMQQHDNLLGQKLATTTRNRLAGSAMIRTSPGLSSSLRVSISTLSNDTDDVSRQVDYTSWQIGASQTLSLGPQRLLRTVGLNYGYQQAGDGAPGRADRRLRAHDVSVRGTLQPRRNLTLTPSIGAAVSSNGAADWEIRQTYGFAAHHRVSAKLATSASLSNSRLNSGGSLNGAVSARYQITPLDQVMLALRSYRVSGLETEAGHFHENRVTLNWSRSIR